MVFRVRSKIRLYGVALFSLALLSCSQHEVSGQAKQGEGTNPTTALKLVALHPDWAVAGQVFNVQPNGTSALAVTCEGATNATRIVFAGERLATVYGAPTLLTAEIPNRLYARPGNFAVYLQDDHERSNVLKFDVR